MLVSQELVKDCMYLTPRECTFVHMHVINERGFDCGLQPRLVSLHWIVHIWRYSKTKPDKATIADYIIYRIRCTQPKLMLPARDVALAENDKDSTCGTPVRGSYQSREFS